MPKSTPPAASDALSLLALKQPELGAAFAAWRRRLDKTQSALAALLGISTQMVRRIEQGGLELGRKTQAGLLAFSRSPQVAPESERLAELERKGAALERRVAELEKKSR